MEMFIRRGCTGAISLEVDRSARRGKRDILRRHASRLGFLPGLPSFDDLKFLDRSRLRLWRFLIWRFGLFFSAAPRPGWYGLYLGFFVDLYCGATTP
jgi:hypothetical protein